MSWTTCIAPPFLLDSPLFTASPSYPSRLLGVHLHLPSAVILIAPITATYFPSYHVPSVTSLVANFPKSFALFSETPAASFETLRLSFSCRFLHLGILAVYSPLSPGRTVENRSPGDVAWRRRSRTHPHGGHGELFFEVPRPRAKRGRRPGLRHGAWEFSTTARPLKCQVCPLAIPGHST